jgi:hypothetical protein
MRGTVLTIHIVATVALPGHDRARGRHGTRPRCSSTGSSTTFDEGSLGGTMTTPAPDTPTLLKGMYAAEAEYLAAGGPGTASFEIMAPFFAPDVVL